MRLSRFRLRTLLGVFVLVGVGLVLWQNVIEPRVFSPELDGCRILADKDRTYNAWIARSGNKARIGHLDLYLIEGTTNSQPGGANYIGSHWIPEGSTHARVEIDGTRVFAREGGLRLFIRWKDGSWEERFIPDEEMEPHLNTAGFLKKQLEFWDRICEP